LRPLLARIDDGFNDVFAAFDLLDWLRRERDGSASSPPAVSMPSHSAVFMVMRRSRDRLVHPANRPWNGSNYKKNFISNCLRKRRFAALQPADIVDPA